MSGAWVDDVLSFWFTELAPEAWFKRSDTVDKQISERFLGAYERLVGGSGGLTPRDAQEALAAVIVLDQFPRNMFRGTAQAFATDAAARAICKAAIAAGFDQQLATDGRLFLYLPLEHSEDPGDQQRSVALIGALGDPRLTEFAVAHQRIIERFGRFPHRNAALGRASTADELAFLQEPGSSF